MNDQTRVALSQLSDQEKIEALGIMGIATSELLDFLIQRIKNQSACVSEDMMLMDLMIARSNISSSDGGEMTTVVICERCGRPLEPDRIVWLELDQRTGKYTDVEVPEEFSQGAFAFGVDCAKAELSGYEEDQFLPSPAG